MLQSMRERFKHLKILLWAVIASFVLLIFVGWGVGTSRMSSDKEGAETGAARVGNDVIHVEDFRRAYFNRIEYMKRLNQGKISEEMLRTMGVPNQVMTALVQQKIALQQADQLGLEPTPKEISEAFQKHPAFLDENGQFVGREMVERYFRYQNRDPVEFSDELAQNLKLGKFRDLLMDSIVVSDQAIKDEHKRRTDKAQVEYVFVAPGKDAQGPSLVDKTPKETLRKYFDAHRDKYRNMQRRARYVVFKTDPFEKDVTVEDTDLLNIYRENAQRYEERRSASSILLKKPKGMTKAEVGVLEKTARDVTERARSGQDFAELAKEFSQDEASRDKGGDLGFFAPGDKEPEFEDAVFTMKEGEIGGPIETNTGFYVIKVTDVLPGKKFEDVKADLLATETRSRARQMVQAAAAEAASKFHDGGDIDALAKEYKLEAVTTDFLNPEAPAVPGLDGNQRRLVDALFKLDKGKINSDPVPSGLALIVFKFEDERGPVDRDLDEVVDQVAVDATAGKFAECLAASGDMAACAGKLGLEVKTSSEFLRAGFISAELRNDPAIIDKAFAMKVNETAGPFEANQGAAFIRLVKRFEFDQKEFEKQAPQIRESLAAQEGYRLISAVENQIQKSYEKQGKIKIYIPDLGG